MNQGAGRVSLARADEASPASVTRSALATMLVVLAMATGLVATIASLRLPILRDEGGFLTMSAVMADGGELYRDFTDRKPPLAFVAIEGVFRAFGTGLVQARAFALASDIAGAIFLFLLARRAALGMAWTGGAVAAFLWLLPVFLGHAPTTEAPVMVLGAAATLLFVEVADPLSWRRAAVAGLLVGVAFLGKQVAVLYLPAFGAWLLIDGVRRRAPLQLGKSLIALGIGSVIPIAICVAWYAHTGRLQTIILSVWTANAGHYTGYPLGEWLYNVARGHFARATPLWFAAAIYGAISIVAYARRGQSRTAALFALVLMTSFVPSMKRPYEHYVLAYLPILVLLGIMGWRELVRRYPARRIAIVAGAAILAIGTVRHYVLYVVPPLVRGTLGQQVAVADRIDAFLAPNEPIYFLGEDKYYFLTGHYRHRPPVFVLPDNEIIIPPEELHRRIRETPGLRYVGIVAGDLGAVGSIVRDVHARGELVFRDSVRGIESIELYRMGDPRRAPTPRPPPG